MFLIIATIIPLLIANCYEAKSLLRPTPTPTDSDVGLNVIELIEKYGYPVESHYITTQDNYILALHRIPYGRKNNDTSNRIPVLLQHGLMSSSADYINMGPDLSIGYLLADRGYDVWLGNARGNAWSRNHTTLDPDIDTEEFYKFSWHEIGIYDLPAIIDYVLDLTGQKDLHYIGHSQGTTEFFVLATERPEYNEKIRLASLMAPVVFMSNLSDPITQFLCQYIFELEDLLNEYKIYELPFTAEIREYGSNNCYDGSPVQDSCVDVLFYIGGNADPEQLNRTMLPVIFTNAPSNVGARQFLHYGQEVNSGYFRQYDYRTEQNLVIYGSEEPPEYDLAEVTAPVALYHGANDDVVSINDLAILISKLPNLANDYLVPYELFNHIDFLFAIDVIPLLYDEMFNVMEQY